MSKEIRLRLAILSLGNLTPEDFPTAEMGELASRLIQSYYSDCTEKQKGRFDGTYETRPTAAGIKDPSKGW